VRGRQDLTPTNWSRISDRSQFEAGYFKDKSQIDDASGTALVDEFLPADATTTTNRADFDITITHFSGDLLSTGRQASNLNNNNPSDRQPSRAAAPRRGRALCSTPPRRCATGRA